MFIQILYLTFSIFHLYYKVNYNTQEEINEAYQALQHTALISKSGEIRYENFFGCGDLESEKELNEDTIFGLASLLFSIS